MVTCEEFNWKSAFGADNLHVTKMLFEGQGAEVRTGLYKQFENAYKSATFVIASNQLPASEA